MKHPHRFLGVVLVIILGFFTAGGTFANPENARYSADGSRLFWFMQISDTHVSTFFNNEYGTRFLRVLDEGVSVIDPWFVVNTGDLTDSTNGVQYGTGPHLDEWLEYRSYLDAVGMRADFYFDVPGNHDAYGDGALLYYLDYSYSGQAYQTTQPYWSLVFSHGRYHFLSVADPANDGLNWPWDNAVYSDDELAGLEDNYINSGEGDFSMLFGHHPLYEVGQHERLLDLLREFNTVYYACGHKHDYVIRFDFDYVMQYRIDSLGQDTKNNVGVYAVDNNALSLGVSGINDLWPLVVVTAPVAARLEGKPGKDGVRGMVDNPYAPPVPGLCERAPVRVLAFDAENVAAVQFRIDGDSWRSMERRKNVPEQWRGYFDATPLDPGFHDLVVEVSASRSRTVETVFRVEDAPCDIGEEDPDLSLEEGRIVVCGEETDGDGDSDREYGPEEAEGDALYPDGDYEVVCTPGDTRCRYWDTVETCLPDGSSWEISEQCEDGTICVDGACVKGGETVDGDSEDDAPEWDRPWKGDPDANEPTSGGGGSGDGQSPPDETTDERGETGTAAKGDADSGGQALGEEAGSAGVSDGGCSGQPGSPWWLLVAAVLCARHIRRRLDWRAV